MPRVEQLAPHQPPGGERDIRRLIHNDGAFSAQLQAHRRQMRGCLFHHQPPHMRAAGEENKVKRLLQQAGVFRASALHHRHILRRKELLRHPAKQRRGGRRVFRRLDHSAVSRRNGTDQRRHRQLKGIVPRRHNQRHAIGLAVDAAPARKLSHCRARPPGPHPPGQMVHGVLELLAHHAHLGQIALKGALPQVPGKRVQHSAFVGVDPVRQRAQLLHAKFVRLCGLTEKIRPLPVDHFRKIVHRFRLPCPSIVSGSMKGFKPLPRRI